MKLVGYILAAIGLIGLAIAMIPQLYNVVPLPKSITSTFLMLVSLAIAAVGIFFIFRAGGGGGKQAEEVPIYKGKNIIGYRRLNK